MSLPAKDSNACPTSLYHFFQRGALQGRIGIESLGRLGKKFLPPLQVQMAKLRLHLSKTAPTSSFLLF